MCNYMRNAMFVCVLLALVCFAFAQDWELTREPNGQNSSSPYSDTYMVLLREHNPQGVFIGAVLVTVVRSLEETQQGMASIVIRVQKKSGNFVLTEEQKTRFREVCEDWFKDSTKTCTGAIVVHGAIGVITLAVQEGNESISMQTQVLLPIIDPSFQWGETSYKKENQPASVQLNAVSANELAVNFVNFFAVTAFAEPTPTQDGNYRYGYRGGEPRLVIGMVLGEITEMLNRPISTYVQAK